MKHVLYLSNISWHWIKQRPQFLAEQLARDYQVDVYYRQPLRKKWRNLPQNTIEKNLHLKVQSFRYLPFNAIFFLKNLPLQFVNRSLIMVDIKNLEQYDIIWFSSPNLYPLIKNSIPSHTKVVYDCMDDHAAFPDADLKRIIAEEKSLMERADYIIFSADYLKKKVLYRYNMLDKECIVVNNAIQIDENKDTDLIPSEISEKIDKIKSLSNPLIYIGTIAEWFDFSTIQKVLDAFPDLNLVLIGPESSSVSCHKQIHHLGSVQHRYIYNIMPLAFALVMPFEITELIKSVNPVKLYEYIYSGRPVIASRYCETEKFREYVNLYSSQHEFMEIIKKIKTESLTEERVCDCKSYVLKNKWENRYDSIKAYLEE